MTGGPLNEQPLKGLCQIALQLGQDGQHSKHGLADGKVSSYSLAV